MFSFLYFSLNSFIVLFLLCIRSFTAVEVLTLDDRKLFKATLRYFAQSDPIIRALSWESLARITLLRLASLDLVLLGSVIAVALGQLLLRQPLRRLVIVLVLQSRKTPYCILLPVLDRGLTACRRIFGLFSLARGVLRSALRLVDRHFPSVALLPSLARSGSLVLSSYLGLVREKLGALEHTRLNGRRCDAEVSVSDDIIV